MVVTYQAPSMAPATQWASMATMIPECRRKKTQGEGKLVFSPSPIWQLGGSEFATHVGPTTRVRHQRQRVIVVGPLGGHIALGLIVRRPTGPLASTEWSMRAVHMGMQLHRFSLFIDQFGADGQRRHHTKQSFCEYQGSNPGNFMPQRDVIPHRYKRLVASVLFFYKRSEAGRLFQESYAVVNFRETYRFSFS